MSMHAVLRGEPEPIDPHAKAILIDMYYSVLNALFITDRADRMTQEIARRILELAKSGGLDRAAICQQVASELRVRAA